MRLPEQMKRGARPEAPRSQTGSLTNTSPAPILAEAEAEALPSCRRCGHPLTAEESVARLLGPVCARAVEGVPA